MLDQSLHRFGPFLIIRTLGRGGMGEVFVARTPWDHQPLAALKRLRPDVARVPTFAERFQHESELAVRLEHPNVVGTLDVGSVDGQLYVASELVLGKDAGLIADRLRERGQGGPAAVAIRLLIDALTGLAYVHGAAEHDGRPLQLVHRDVTPGNLLVGYDGVARVADFGLAKSLLTERSNLTNHGEILGTPHYLAPEVIRGESASPASDLYGLGAVMYRFLTGVAPHQGTTAEVLLKVLQEEPRPLSDLRPDLPPWLVTFIHRLLEKDPSRRPGDADPLIDQLITDAKRGGLFVARGAVGQWLVSLFEVEHADEIDESERIASIESDSPPAPEGTVVLARSAPESRLEAPGTQAFRRYEESGGTELELSEVDVRASFAALPSLVDPEEDPEMPTRAVTIFPGGGLIFDDGTKLEQDSGPGDEDTFDPEGVHPSNAATQWGEVVPSPEPAERESEIAATELPGFVDGHHGVPRPGSYDPGTTNPDPHSEPPVRQRPRNRDSVVVSPVESVPASVRPERRPPVDVNGIGARDPGPPVPERPRARPAQRPSDPSPFVAPPATADRPRPSGSNPDQKPSSEGRHSRGKYPAASSPKVRITHVPPPAQRAANKSKNLVMAGALLAGAVALGVGIGAVVATIKARREPTPLVTGSKQVLADRFMNLRKQMDARLAAGDEVPNRVRRLANDAADALIAGDPEAARLYLDELERLMRVAPDETAATP